MTQSSEHQGQRDKILLCAVELRGALNRIDPATWNKVTIDNFPRGACQHCSELLARYLNDMLGIEATYASGCVRHLVDAETHAWLEFDSLYIDISADQFGLPEVIVERRSPFHEQALDVYRHSIICDHFWGFYCSPVYQEAIEIIDS